MTAATADAQSRWPPLRSAAVVLASALALGALAGLAGLALRTVDGAPERVATDLRFSLRGDRAASTDVVVVALDATSFGRLPNPPLPRSLDAQLVRRLARAGAATIAFDFSLERPSADASGDRALVAAFEQARHAVVSITSQTSGGHLQPLAGRVAFAGTGVRPGSTLLAVDPDESVRVFPPSFGSVESFAAAAAGAFAGDAVHVRPPAGALIDYPGPAGTVPQLSFERALRGHFDARAVRGKVVVVGPTAVVLQDRHRTPVGAAMPGPEIQADAIATALDGFPLRRASAAADVWIALLAGFLVPLLLAAGALVRARRSEVPPAPPGGAAVASTGAAVALGWLVLAQVAFDRGTVMEVTPGLVAIVASTVAAWGASERVHRRRRARLRERFAARDAGVVQQVLGTRRAGRGALAADDVIAGYTLLGRAGEGGMGVVYCARQARLDRVVALKLIAAEYAHERAYRERFVGEARAAARVSHPHVVPVFDAGDDGGLLYIALQYVDGIDLDGALRRLGPLDACYAARLMHQVGGALDAAHALGIVHRDVKPANVIISAADPEHAYLTDFGLARAAGDPVERGMAGTADYLAPEQAGGGAVDRRADVYALAAVVYHCLTGAPPFESGDRATVLEAHRSALRPAPSRRRGDLPASLDTVVARGMAIDPNDRYASATEFTRAVCAAVGSRLEPPAAAVPAAHAARAPAPSPDAVSRPRTEVSPAAPDPIWPES